MTGLRLRAVPLAELVVGAAAGWLVYRHGWWGVLLIVLVGGAGAGLALACHWWRQRPRFVSLRWGRLMFWTARLDDPRAAGVHQAGRLEWARYQRWHGTVSFIQGLRRGRRDPARERAWVVFW